MPREEKDIIASISRIERVVVELKLELLSLKSELDDFSSNTTLDIEFFWDKLFPVLQDSPGGLSSSALRMMFQRRGVRFPEGNFRTFLSRYRHREMLEKIAVSGSADLWTLSAKAIETAKKLSAARS